MGTVFSAPARAAGNRGPARAETSHALIQYLPNTFFHRPRSNIALPRRSSDFTADLELVETGRRGHNPDLVEAIRPLFVSQGGKGKEDK
jgi:hypothetical protein